MATKKKADTTTTDKRLKDQEFVRTVRTGLESWMSATMTHRQDVYDDNQFNIGGQRQWKDADVASLTTQKRPILAFNAIAPIINFVAGYASEKEQDFRGFPRGSEDEQLGRLMTALMKYAMDAGGGAHKLHSLFRKGIIGGLSVLEVQWTTDLVDDLVEGEIGFTVLPENSWACEVGAREPDRNDAAWQDKLMWMDPTYAKRKWPDAKDAFMTRSGTMDWIAQDPLLTGTPAHLLKELYDEKTGRVRILQHWYRVPTEVALVVNTQTGDVQRMESAKAADDFLKSLRDQAGATAAAPYSLATGKRTTDMLHAETGQVLRSFRTEDDAMRAMDQLKVAAGLQATSMFNVLTRDTTALRVAHLTGWRLLDDGPSPNGADWRYPFCPFIACQDTDDYSAIKGIVRDLKDAQQEINWHHSTMLDGLMRSPKNPVWIQKSEAADIAKIKRELPRAGFVGEYATSPPTMMPTNPLQQGDLMMIEFATEAIMRTSGVNAELMGQTTQKTVSGRAIGARQAGGLVGIASVMLNWAACKQQIGELLLRRIQQYYSPEKMDRIIGQQQRMAQQSGALQGILPPQQLSGQQMYASFKAIKDIDMDVVIGFQEASPTSRMAVAQQMLQFMAAGAPIPMEFVIEASDIPRKEEIVAILKTHGQQPPNEALGKIVGASQGSQPSPNGVNQT
jgi:hypothetical protein